MLMLHLHYSGLLSQPQLVIVQRLVISILVSFGLYVTLFSGCGAEIWAWSQNGGHGHSKRGMVQNFHALRYCVLPLYLYVPGPLLIYLATIYGISLRQPYYIAK